MSNQENKSCYNCANPGCRVLPTEYSNEGCVGWEPDGSPQVDELVNNFMGKLKNNEFTYGLSEKDKNFIKDLVNKKYL